MELPILGRSSHFLRRNWSYRFGAIGKNYRETAAAVGLTADEIITLARNSFNGSFLTPEEQARHLKDIDKTAAALA